MAKTVAFPVIGIGLDANPLKRGLQDAKASVAGTVAGIQDSAQKLSSTKFVTGDIYGFKDELPPTNAGAMDIVDKFNARKAAEAAAKASEKKAREDAKAAKAAQAERERIRRETIAPMHENSASLIPKDLQAGVDMLLESERTAKKLYAEFDWLHFNLSKHFKAAGAGLRGAVAAASRVRLNLGGMALKGAGSLASGLLNPLGMLTKMSMPLNQALELGGKAVRVFGAPVRAAMSYEAENNRAVYQGGRSMLNDSGWTGTMTRFGLGVEKLFTGILNAINKSFDFTGWLEAARGFFDGVTLFWENFSRLTGGNQSDPESAFMTGQDNALYYGEQGLLVLADIYNTAVDILDWLRTSVGYSNEQENAIAQWQKDNTYKKEVFFWGRMQEMTFEGTREDAIAALREQGTVPGFGAGKINKDNIVEAFDAARFQLWLEREWNNAMGRPNNAVDVSEKAKDDATRSLKELVAGMNTGKTPFEQAQAQYEQALEQISRLAIAGADDNEVSAALDAAALQRDLAIMEGLKPMMQMQEQSRFSVSFEPNSQALIESMIRAQTGTGSDNPQERVAQAVALQNKILAEQKKLQEQQLEALRAIRNKPGAVFVGGAG